MRTTRLLILDCDGVLVRSERANLAYYNHLFDAFGLAPVGEDDRGRLGLLHTLSTPQVIEAFFPEAVRAAVTAFAADVQYSAFLGLLDAEPGWHGVLSRLRAFVPVAVATNRGHSAREVLESVGLLALVDLVVTVRDVAHPKPHPAMLLKVLEHFDVAAADAVYVGDSTLDRRAAGDAGVPFIGFRDGTPEAAAHPEEVETRVCPVAPVGFSASMDATARGEAPRTTKGGRR